MGYKKYITNNSENITFENGGVPIFLNDLQQLETNSKIFGLYQKLKGFAVIIDGCFVDEINTTTKKLSLTEGHILLNDTVYYIPKITNQNYPFTIEKGLETTHQRRFKTGDIKNVNIEYDYSINTNLVYDLSVIGTANLYPSNFKSDSILFDPFSCQRAENVLENLSLKKNELQLFDYQNDAVVGQVNKSETGKNIVGTPLNFADTPLLKWKHYGWVSDTTIKRNVRFSNLIDSGKIGGNLKNEIQLLKTHLPPHKHEHDIIVKGNEGQHNHNSNTGSFSEWGGSRNMGDGGSGTNVSLSNGTTKVKDGEGQHTHTIEGGVKDNYNSEMKSTKINVENEYINIAKMRWVGYDTYDNNFLKFWQDGTYYLPNM